MNEAGFFSELLASEFGAFSPTGRVIVSIINGCYGLSIFLKQCLKSRMSVAVTL